MVKSKAAVAFEPGKPLEIVEVDVQDPKAGEVMVKIDYTSLCHTDIYSVSGNDPSASFPFIPGHEAAGTVVKVGEGVTNVKVGDSVIPTWKPECGECEYCQKGLNFCSAVSESQGAGVMRDGTSRFSYKGEPIAHFMGISSFSEYTVVNDINVCKIPEDAPKDKVCLLGCGVTTGLKSVENDVQVEEGATAAAFYINATQEPWSKHYFMYDYLTKELNQIVYDLIPNYSGKESIMGHSMGGYGALQIGMKNPDRFESISAFAPITNPTKVPWGQKIFSNYLGEDQTAWEQWDTVSIIKEAGDLPPILIYQGTADDFYDVQLQGDTFLKAGQDKDITYEKKEGYDHNYFFISTFVEDHIDFHAKHLA